MLDKEKISSIAHHAHRGPIRNRNAREIESVSDGRLINILSWPPTVNRDKERLAAKKEYLSAA